MGPNLPVKRDWTEMMDDISTPLPVDDFPYPPLGTDAIRILNVEPGDFDKQITCTLSPVAFNEKPKYSALSYTWGDPYPGDAARPKDGATFIIVNNHHFPVKPNLHLALQYLRSPSHPLPIWVDAICIEQKNIVELNHHVTMMSFIYQRAAITVAWLGPPGARQNPSWDWRVGKTQHVAKNVLGSAPPYYSAEPDNDTFGRIAKSSYWTRVWIVQELCLPRHLVFAYGENLWRHGDLCNWSVFRQAKLTVEKPGADLLLKKGVEGIARLLDVRKIKYSDQMTIEYLIESFSKASCTEIRDKIYSLLGLANDIIPCTDGDADPIEQHNKTPVLQNKALSEPWKGRTKFQVDYSKTLYEVWVDVLKYLFFQAQKAGGRHITQAMEAAGIRRKIPEVNNVDVQRGITIVRTSCMIQEALEQSVEEQLETTIKSEESILSHGFSDRTMDMCQDPVIKAVGYLSGEVLEIGPEYTSLVASFSSHQAWLYRIENYYIDPSDRQTIRGTYDSYIEKILGYGTKELSRVQNIRNVMASAWSVMGRRPQVQDAEHISEDENTWENVSEQKEGHSIAQYSCLCTGNQIAVVPSDAKPGDVIVSFWGCDVSLLMRPSENGTDDKTAAFTMIGTVDFVEIAHHNVWSGFSGILCEKYARGGPIGGGAVYVELDFRTLQRITASEKYSHFNGTRLLFSFQPGVSGSASYLAVGQDGKGRRVNVARLHLGLWRSCRRSHVGVPLKEEGGDCSRR
ncbi:heterokaryon incompatibility protein-domain-containing protein [Hypoxylon sp. NC1633]|nr:heterokaryon incompatibility protein-domain-containing protein [Hypoxylon sp. NC1633]